MSDSELVTKQSLKVSAASPTKQNQASEILVRLTDANHFAIKFQWSDF